MDWRTITEGVETVQIDQLRQIKEAEQVEAVRKAEIEFEIANGAGLHGYLLDLQDSIRYTALSFIKNPVRDYVLSGRILNQFQNGVMSSEHLSIEGDKRFAGMLREKVQGLNNDSKKMMTPQQLTQAAECNEAMDLIPILRYVSLNIARREEFEVVKKAYKRFRGEVFFSIWKNATLVILTILILALIYYFFARYLLPVGFFNLINLATLGLLTGTGVVTFLGLRVDLPKAPPELKEKYLGLQQENWFSLNPGEISIGKQYIDKSSQEIQELMQAKTNLVIEILGDEWEKNYHGDYILMY